MVVPKLPYGEIYGLEYGTFVQSAHNFCGLCWLSGQIGSWERYVLYLSICFIDLIYLIFFVDLVCFVCFFRFSVQVIGVTKRIYKNSKWFFIVSLGVR